MRRLRTFCWILKAKYGNENVIVIFPNVFRGTSEKKSCIKCKRVQSGNVSDQSGHYQLSNWDYFSIKHSPHRCNKINASHMWHSHTRSPSLFFEALTTTWLGVSLAFAYSLFEILNYLTRATVHELFILKVEEILQEEMSILVTAIRSGNLEVVKEKFARPVSFMTMYFKSLCCLSLRFKQSQSYFEWRILLLLS